MEQFLIAVKKADSLYDNVSWKSSRRRSQRSTSDQRADFLKGASVVLNCFVKSLLNALRLRFMSWALKRLFTGDSAAVYKTAPCPQYWDVYFPPERYYMHVSNCNLSGIEYNPHADNTVEFEAISFTTCDAAQSARSSLKIQWPKTSSQSLLAWKQSNQEVPFLDIYLNGRQTWLKGSSHPASTHFPLLFLQKGVFLSHFWALLLLWITQNTNSWTKRVLLSCLVYSSSYSPSQKGNGVL